MDLILSKQYLRQNFLMLATAALLILPSQSKAATYLVHPDGAGDFPTIQEAINMAIDGDTILLGDGIFQADEGEFRAGAFIGKAIVIKSQSGDPKSCRVQGFASAFGFYDDEGRDSVLEGITISHSGMGVYILSCSPTIRNCIFTNNYNRTSYGSAVWLRHGRGSPLLEDCRFENNEGYHGGAVGVSLGGSPVFLRCEFYGNRSRGSGGAISFYGAGGASVSLIENCTFVGNSGNIGSAVRANNGMILEIENSIFAQNLGGPPISQGVLTEIELACCNIFDNEWGDWVGSIEDQFQTIGNMSVPSFFCNSDEGNLQLASRSPCLSENATTGCTVTLGANLTASEACSGRPRIIGITDHADDEGNQVDVSFVTSAWELPENSVQPYRIQRLDHDQWLDVQQLSPDGSLVRQATVATRLDSISGQPGGLQVFRVVVEINGNQLFSDSEEGYSLDNQPPGPVTELSAESSLDGIHLSWQALTGSDVLEYRIFQDDDPDIPLSYEVATVTADTFLAQPYSPGNLTYFKVAAVDTAGNMGPAPQSVECVSPPLVSVIAFQQQTLGNRVLILSWEQSRSYGECEYRVFRQSGPEKATWEQLDLQVTQSGQEFQAVDHAAPSGTEVPYKVEIGVDDHWWTLLETDSVAIPNSPLNLGFDQNPMRSSTRFSVYLPGAGPTRVDIFGLSGRKHRTLVNERRLGGPHEFLWDGTDSVGRPLASGVYFVRLTHSGLSQTKKIVVVR